MRSKAAIEWCIECASVRGGALGLYSGPPNPSAPSKGCSLSSLLTCQVSFVAARTHEQVITLDASFVAFVACICRAYRVRAVSTICLVKILVVLNQVRVR